MKNTGIFFGIAVVLVAGSVLLFSDSAEAPDALQADQSEELGTEAEKAESKLPAGTISFGGTLDAVSTACFADGVCSATIEGKTVILIEGFRQGVVGEVRFEDGIGGLEAHVGNPVGVFAEIVSEGEYTLYGSEEYYIEPAI